MVSRFPGAWSWPRRSSASSAPVAMPSLHPVPAVSSGPAWLPDGGFRSGALITAVVGGAAGVCLAGLILRAGPAGRPAAEWRGLAASLGLAGTFLGWQAAVSIATLMTMVYFVYASTWMHRVRARDRSLTTFAAAATLVQIALWRACRRRPSGRRTHPAPALSGSTSCSSAS